MKPQAANDRSRARRTSARASVAEEPRQRFSQMIRLNRSFRLLWTAAPGLTVANGALVLLQSVIPAASLYLVKQIVDSVGAVASSQGPDLLHVGIIVGLAAAVALFGAVLDSIGTYLQEAHSQSVTNYVQGILHQKSVDVDLAYYENSKYYDALHRAQEEAPMRPPLILRGLLQSARNAAYLLSVGALLLFELNWIFVLALLGTAAPIVWLRLRQAGFFYRWRLRRTETERRVWYLNLLLTGGWFAKEIRTYRLGKLLAKRSEKYRNQLKHERLTIARKRAYIDLTGNASQTLVIFGAVVYLVFQTLGGAVSLGSLVMLYQALQRGRGYMQMLLSGIADLYENSLFLSNLWQFLLVEPRITSPELPTGFPESIRKGVTFDDVTFAYPDASRPALDRVSVTFRPGEITALVGANGAGKTTLVRLLARLYDPVKGSIRIDGVDLRDLALDELRAQISVVFQDFNSYHLTVSENIWFGDASREPDRELVEKAAAITRADTFINSLPDKYDTTLGKWFGDGSDLSTGQWKKLALARALYRPGKILVLDEPLAALDSDSESGFIQKLHDLCDESRIVVVASHHDTIIREADNVVRLAHGRIDEAANENARHSYRTGAAEESGRAARPYAAKGESA